MSVYGAAWREGGALVRGALLAGARAGELLARGLGAPTLAPSSEALRTDSPAERFEEWVAAYDAARARVDGMPLATLYGLTAGSGPTWSVLRPLATARGWNATALEGLRAMERQGATPGLPALLRWDGTRREWIARRLAAASPVNPGEPPSSEPPRTPGGGLSGLGALVIVGLLVFTARTALDPRATRWGV